MITIYELLKHGLKGSLPQRIVDVVVANSAAAFVVAGIDTVGVLDRAARISHDMGMAMAHALIAASLEAVGCDQLYTTDSDFEAYDGPMQVMYL